MKRRSVEGLFQHPQAIALTTLPARTLLMLAFIRRSAVVPNAAALEAVAMGKQRITAELSSPSASTARSGSLQNGSAQQPRLASLAPCVRVRHRSVHRLVLLRASAGLQPHRRRALSHVPGIAASGRQHHQPAACSRAAAGSRSCRLWLAESRVGCGNQPGERSQAARISLRELVERGAESEVLKHAGGTHARQARLRDAGHAVRLWLSQIGTRRFGAGRHPDAPGTLGSG